MNSAINDPIFKDLEQSIVDPNLAKLAEDYAQIAFDIVIGDPTLKEIPVLGTIIGLYKATLSISNRILMNKVLSFLTELREIPEEKRCEEIAKLNSNPKYFGRVGETLFLFLEKQNSIVKPSFLAKGFKAYLMGKITYETFLRLANAIDKLDMTFMNSIKDFYGDESKMVQEQELEHLFSCGLVRLDFKLVGTWGGGAPKYEKNELGIHFYEHILK